MFAATAKSALPLLALGVALLGCSDRTGTSPSAAAPALLQSTADLLKNDGSTRVIPVLQRTESLGTAYKASAVIGPEGGTLAIPEAGLTVTFPAGALAAPQTISVSAHAGKSVGYTFAPHGIQFAKGVRVSQSLQGTEAQFDALLQTTLGAGYFGNDLDASEVTGRATVLEMLPASLDLAGTVVSFDVWHFSGYIVTCGRRNRD